MTIIVNGQEVIIDTDSETITVGDLIKHLEINFLVDVEKNGLPADKGVEIADGDDIHMERFVGAG